MNLNRQQRHAIALLQQNPARDLYEAADGTNTRKGCGLYYVTYCPKGDGPQLTRSDVEGLLAERLIKPKWADAAAHFYVLSSTRTSKAEGT